MNESVGSAAVATTESPVDVLRMMTVFPFTLNVPVLPELSSTLP